MEVTKQLTGMMIHALLVLVTSFVLLHTAHTLVFCLLTSNKLGAVPKQDN